MIKDYELKQKLIKNNKFRLFRKCKWVIHKVDSDINKLLNRKNMANELNISIDITNELVNAYNYNINYSDDGALLNLDYETSRFYMDTLFNDKEELRVLGNLDHAKTRRKSRLKKYIKYLISNYECVFLTLTFTNETLEKNKLDTLQEKVCKYLNDAASGLYVANIDYGSKNERVHYHAICPIGINYKKWHKYGAIKGLKINVLNEGAMAEYISKLENHATKESVKQFRTIYGKKLKAIMAN